MQNLRAVLTVLLPDEALVMQSADIKARYAVAIADAPSPGLWKDLRNRIGDRGNLSGVPGPHERFLYD